MDDATREAVHEAAALDLSEAARQYDQARELALRSREAYLEWVQAEGDLIAEQVTEDMRARGWLRDDQRLVFATEELGTEVLR